MVPAPSVFEDRSRSLQSSMRPSRMATQRHFCKNRFSEVVPLPFSCDFRGGTRR